MAKIKKISNHCYAVLDMKYPLGKVNSGFIESNKFVIIVDSGCSCFEANNIINFINKRIKKPIKYLIIFFVIIII